MYFVFEQEKSCNARFLQYASGANVLILWAMSILWDLLTNCITIILIIILVASKNDDDWKHQLGTIFLLMFVYNLAMIPLICLLSLIFSKPSLGMVVVTFLNFVFGMYVNTHRKPSLE